jgi:peptidoglycan/xylan/chitin deacetylase (PgdA/CDA1 family)
VNAASAPRRVLRGLRSARNRVANLLDPPILVLAYHRVADLAVDPQGLAVRPDRFREQMRALRQRRALLRLEESWPRMTRPAAIVTFDDGYADNAATALPILEEERVPATFFVTTGAVETGREFWWDELERCLLAGASLPERLEIGEGGERRAWPLETSEERQSCYDALHGILRRAAPGPRDRLVEDLRAACGVDPCARPSHRPLRVDEVARLGKSPWATVGSHGVTHTPFALLPREAQREEMRASRERLRAWSDAEVDMFSFPFGGRRDFTRESVDVAREAGYRRVAVNVPGQVHRWTDPFALPRFLVRDWPSERFVAELDRFETA